MHPPRAGLCGLRLEPWSTSPPFGSNPDVVSPGCRRSSKKEATGLCPSPPRKIDADCGSALALVRPHHRHRFGLSPPSLFSAKPRLQQLLQPAAWREGWADPRVASEVGSPPAS